MSSIITLRARYGGGDERVRLFFFYDSRFLKSKVAIIQTELESVQKQNEANVKDLNLALDRLKQLENFKEQLLTKNAALERMIKKYEERNLELDKQVKV